MYRVQIASTTKICKCRYKRCNFRGKHDSTMTVHIHPIDEPHELAMNCLCDPMMEVCDDRLLVIHNSFDGREGLESSTGQWGCFCA